MSFVSPVRASSFESFVDADVKIRRATQGSGPEVFTDIYLEETNMVIWHRRSE